MSERPAERPGLESMPALRRTSDDDDDVRGWRRAHARLLQLYEVGKVLTRFDDVERVLSDVLTLVCATVPLRIAVLMLDDPHAPRRTRALVWHAHDVSAGQLIEAQAQARSGYEYLTGRVDDTDPEPYIGALLPVPSVEPSPAVHRAGQGFVLLPLVAVRGIFGALQVEGRVRLDGAGLTFVDAVVNHLAIALDRFAVLKARDADALARQQLAEATLAAAVRAEQEQRFLSRTSALLATPLDERATHAIVVHAAVSMLADVCVLDSVDEQGRIERLEVAFADPEQAHLADRLKALPPTAAVLQSGRSLLVPEVVDAESIPLDRPEAEALKAIGAQSVMIVPLIARGRALGALTLVSTSGRKYSVEDLDLAEDVARRAALAADSVRLYEQAQRAVKSRQDLLELVSHDLKNPLASILLGAAALKRGLSLEDSLALRNLDIIQRSAEAMHRIILDLLDLASIDAGRLSIDLQRVRVVDLIAEVFERHAGEASRKAIHLERIALDDRVEIMCDRGRLLQVIGNVLGNAIKFTPPGGNVEMRAQVRGSDVLFEVTDSGPGITAQELPHVFDRYWQAHGTAHLGTGLGLSIAKGLVEAQGGRIWAESTIGVGTIFAFTIPQSEPSLT